MNELLLWLMMLSLSQMVLGKCEAGTGDQEQKEALIKECLKSKTEKERTTMI